MYIYIRIIYIYIYTFVMNLFDDLISTLSETRIRLILGDFHFILT